MTVPENKVPSRSRLLKAAPLALLAAAGGGHASQSTVSSRRSAQPTISHERGAEVEVPHSGPGAFNLFGSQLRETPATLPAASQTSAGLDFLRRNGLLQDGPVLPALLSGDVDFRKDFAHDHPSAHCHFPSFGTYYTSTASSLNTASCASLSGSWHEASTRPAILDSSISNKTATGFQVNFRVSEPSTVYAVLLPAGNAAPDSDQVIAGQDGNGAAAWQSQSVAASSTSSLSFSGLDANGSYLLYLAARDSGGETSSSPAILNPAFETGAIPGSGYWKFPKLRVDADGNFLLAQSNASSISFKSWDGSGFSEFTSIAGGVVAGRPNVGWGNSDTLAYAVQPNNRLHVTLNMGEGQMATSSDPFYGYFNGSSWSFDKIAETGFMGNRMDIAIDAAGKAHVVYNVAPGGGHRLEYATNASGSWQTRTLVTTGSGGIDEIQDARLVVASDGTVHIVYRREDSQNLGQDNYYLTSSSDNFSVQQRILDGKGDAQTYRLGGFALDAQNKLHYAYGAGGQSWYVTNASGSWQQQEIPAAGRSAVSAFDLQLRDGTVYIAASSGSQYFLSSYANGTWTSGIDFKMIGTPHDRFGVSSSPDRVQFVSENSGDWTIHYHTARIGDYVRAAVSNQAPTALSLSSLSVKQSDGANAQVGALSGSDPDGDTLSFSLVAGSGDSDNALFNISGSSLRANDAAALTAGSYSLRIRGDDGKGGTYEQSFSVTVVDDIAPVISFSNLALSSDTGTSSSDFVTRTAAQSISATLSAALAPTDSVQGSLDAGATWTDLTAKVSGTLLSWDGVTLSGSNTLHLKVRDAAGNDGPIATQAYVLDSSAPLAPSTPDLASGSDSGTSNSDDITSVSTPTFSGTAENGSTVTLYDTDGSTVLGSGSALGGSWSITVSELGTGSHSIRARASDVAGNVSAPSSALALTIDGTAPTILSVALPADAAYGLAQTLSFTLNLSESVHVDSSNGTPRLPLVIGGSTMYASYVSGSGGTALTFRYTIQAGDHDSDGITLGEEVESNGGSLRDLAGNALSAQFNAVGSTAGVRVHARPPTVSDAHLAISGASGSAGAYRIGDTVTASWNNSATGDNNSDAIASVSFDFSAFGGPGAVAATASSDIWSATHTLSAGLIDADNINVSVTVTDATGNVSTATDSSNASVDTIAPSFTSGATASAQENVAVTAAVYTAAAGADLVSYAISGGADQTRFSLDKASGKLFFAASPDFEQPGDADADNDYEVEITATDNAGNSTVLPLALTVTDQSPEPPRFTSGASASVAEGQSAAYTASAVDPEGQSQPVFSLSGGTDAALFSIDASSGALRFGAAPDFEAPADANADNVYELTVRAALGAQTSDLALSISVRDINDPPTLSVSASNPTYVEGAAAAPLFSKASVSTVEAGQQLNALTLTITGLADGAEEILSVDGSELALSHGNTLTTAINGLNATVSLVGDSASVSLDGGSLSPAAMQSLIDGLAYRHGGENPSTGLRTLTLTTLRDSGGNADGGTDSAGLAVASSISLTPVNDAPVLGGISTESSTLTAGSGFQGLDLLADASVSDVDSADFNGGSLSISQTDGNANGAWGLDGTAALAGDDGSIAALESINVGGNSIGTVEAGHDGQAGRTLVIQLNAAATPSTVQSLLRALRYAAPSGQGTRDFTVSLDDADGGDSPGSADFSLLVAPSPPVLGQLDGDRVSTPYGVPVGIDAGADATVSDADSANFDGGIIMIQRLSALSGDFSLGDGVLAGSDAQIAAGESLLVDGAVIGTVINGGHGQGTTYLRLRLSIEATPARIQTLLRALRYGSTQPGIHDFQLGLSDASGVAGAASTTVAFEVQVNAPPVNSLPGGFSMQDGALLPLPGISVSDADGAWLSSTLSIGAGSLSVDEGGGASISGNNSANLQIAGSTADVNAALATLRYRAPLNSAQPQTLSLTTSDGVDSDSDSLLITLLDRPDISGLDGSLSYAPGSGALRLDSAGQAAISDLDSADFNGGSLSVRIVAGGDSEEDLLGFITGNELVLSGPTAGSTVAVHGVVIGTLGLDIGAGQALVVNFNGNATPERVSLLLRALSYENLDAQQPTAGTRVVEITLDDNQSAPVTLSLEIQVHSPADEGNVIVSPTPNQGVITNPIIRPSGSVQGGTLAGRVENQGRISDLNLAPGTVVRGGTLAGAISGNPVQPARIEGARVASGARLENVTLDQNTILEPGVQIGANVRFESSANIPAGLDLSGALRRLDWVDADGRGVLALDGDVISPVDGSAPMTLIRSIQLLGEYEPAGNAVEQDSNGEVLIVTADSSSAVLPVNVSQARPDEPEGTYLNEDGDIVFVTVSRRVVLAYPALQDKDGLRAALASFGLALGFDARANLVAALPGSQAASVLREDGTRGQAQALSTTASFYYAGRPEVSALPAPAGAQPGVHYGSVPGLPRATAVSLVFRTAEGELLAQDIVPVPADWPMMKESLQGLGFSEVRIDTQGIVSVRHGNGTLLRGRSGFRVSRDAAQLAQPGRVVFRAAGDPHEDGTEDFQMVFPNGDTQMLYILPEQP